MDEGGGGVANAETEPPTRKSNSPAAAWGFVPVTGASKSSHPRCVAAAASSYTQATVSVLDSTSTEPGEAPASPPSSPNHPALDPASSATILMIISAPAPAFRD